MQNASFIEWLWTLLTAVGLLLEVTLLRESIKDIQAVDAKNIKNGRRRIALGTRRSEAIKLFVIFTFFLIGVVSMFTPPVEGATNRNPAFVSILVGVCFIVSMLLMVVDSWMNTQLRSHLINGKIRDEEWDKVTERRHDTNPQPPLEWQEGGGYTRKEGK